MAELQSAMGWSYWCLSSLIFLFFSYFSKKKDNASDSGVLPLANFKLQISRYALVIVVCEFFFFKKKDELAIGTKSCLLLKY
jgi:hypothetical protein